jgi:hypothetical protein
MTEAEAEATPRRPEPRQRRRRWACQHGQQVLDCHTALNREAEEQDGAGQPPDIPALTQSIFRHSAPLTRESWDDSSRSPGDARLAELERRRRLCAALPNARTSHSRSSHGAEPFAG